MKIVQVHKYWWRRDGASNYALDLSFELQKRGHTVIPFAMQQSETAETGYNQYFVSNMDISNPDNLSLKQKIQHAVRMWYSREAKLKMAALLDAEKPDVVHVHNIYHHISPSIITEIKKRGIPIVMTLHDYKLISPNYSMFHHGKIQEGDANAWYLGCIANKCMKDSYINSAVASFEMFLHHKILRIFKKVDMFIAPSMFMKRTCERFGWKSHKFTHIVHPIDTQKYAVQTADLGYVAYIGRLSEEKGLHQLLQAAQKTPEISYKIVGTGPETSSLHEFVRANGLQNVEFTGFKTGAHLERLIKNARIIALPSVWYENYPISILEAKAMGKIVVGSDIGGIPELVDRRFLAESGNIEELTSVISKWHSADAKVRRSIGLHNRSEVEHNNSVRVHIDAIEGLYRSLVNDR